MNEQSKPVPLPDVPLAWANREQLLLCSRQPREHRPGEPLLHNLPRNVAGSALRTEYCNTPLYPRPAVLPGSWMLVERGIWSEAQVEEAAACITRLRPVPGMTDRDLAMAALDAGQVKAPAVTLGDLLPLLEEEQALDVEEDADHRCPDRALKSALFACLAAGASDRRYGGVLIDGGRYAWVNFSTTSADEPPALPVKWWNGCDREVPAALRFLANNERPSGGESRFNAEHLYQLAGEIERMAKMRLFQAPPQPLAYRGDGEPVLGWIDPERDEFLSGPGRERAESMGHGHSAKRFSVPVVPAAESEHLRGLLAEALLAIEGGCHAASLPDRIRAMVEGVEVDDEFVEPSAPKVDAVAMRVAMDNLAVQASAGAAQAPVVLLSDTCLRVTYSGLKWYHEQLVNDRWVPLSVDEFDELLAAALEKAG